MLTIVTEASNKTLELLKKVRDRLGIKAEIRVDNDDEEVSYVYFDEWLSIAVYYDVYEEKSIAHKKSKRLCFGVDIWKTYPATYHEPEDVEQIDQGTFVGVIEAISHLIGLYYEHIISQVFQSIDEEKFQSEVDTMYEEMSAEMSILAEPPE